MLVFVSFSCGIHYYFLQSTTSTNKHMSMHHAARIHKCCTTSKFKNHPSRQNSRKGGPLHVELISSVNTARTLQDTLDCWLTKLPTPPIPLKLRVCMNIFKQLWPYNPCGLIRTGTLNAYLREPRSTWSGELCRSRSTVRDFTNATKRQGAG